MLKIICDTNSLSDEKYAEYLQIADKTTIEKAKRFRFETDKKCTVAGNAIAREALSEMLKKPPREIEILRTESGKPYINDDIFFNISHSEGVVAIVFSENEIGVDTEKIRPVDYRIAEKFYTENEKRYIMSAKNEDEKLLRFFEIWTLKESYLKCTGDGLPGGLKSVEFSIKDNQVFCSESGFVSKTELYNKFIISITEKKLTADS